MILYAQYAILRTLQFWNHRGWLPLFLFNFLQDHYFCVHLSNVLSAHCPQENRVPQRSILSINLVAFGFNGMDSLLGPNILRSLYDDDVTIFYGSQSTDTSVSQHGFIRRFLLIYFQSTTFSDYAIVKEMLR
jgi:hypothetical protein